MLCLTARAKINWSLDILGRRDDGYHEMDMLMGSVELADTLTIVPSDALALHVNGDASLQTQDNLVLKAAKLLADTCGCAKGASLTLTKAVPFGAGMGGGSADAAAARRAGSLAEQALLRKGITGQVSVTLSAGCITLVTVQVAAGDAASARSCVAAALNLSESIVRVE